MLWYDVVVWISQLIMQLMLGDVWDTMSRGLRPEKSSE